LRELGNKALDDRAGLKKEKICKTGPAIHAQITLLLAIANLHVLSYLGEN
jgi:hypothetical protein